MKKNLLTLLTFISALVASSQCTPGDYIFSGAFGVSPDPALGESFEVGELGAPYSDVIYMLVPNDAAEVNPLLVGFVIDSLKLLSVSVYNGTDFVDISTIGLGFTCNNLNDSPDPCTFLGGTQYCADLTGTPTQPGVFPLQINVLGYVTSKLFGSQEAPYTFENYSLTVIDPDAVVEITKQEIGEVQNTPNPVVTTTEISFELAKADVVKLNVSNLLGETIFTKTIVAKRGANHYVLDASTFRPGLYLYSIASGEKKITKRMVVN
ncbi:MAG: T9SS type A sorting domain-containing protein [Flavobacteriales bacterium]|nr:T9SS type A sorting domain-containing protein [Flavobacteriales bacterium]